MDFEAFPTLVNCRGPCCLEPSHRCHWACYEYVIQFFDGAENRWPTILIGRLCSSFRSFFLPRLFLAVFILGDLNLLPVYYLLFFSSPFSSVTSGNIKTGGRIIICQIPSLNQYVIGLLLLSLNDHNPVNVIVSWWVLFFFAS